MGEAVNSIVDFCQSIADLIVMILKGFLSLVKIIPRSASFLAECTDFIPDLFKPFVFLTISGSILFLILGRNSGKD